MSYLSTTTRTAVVVCALALCAAKISEAQDIIESGSPWNYNYGDLEEREELQWSLFDTTGTPFEVGGWLSAGYTGNAHSNRTGNGNAPLVLNNVADAPVLNQLWIYAEKPLDMEHNEFDWGFRFDYLFGADAPDFQAVGDEGWDFGWNSSRDYGSAIPQLYAQMGYHDLSVFAGYGFGLLGFETGQAVDTFFYSHNYAFGYGVPGTHSGVLAEYAVNDAVTLIGGWVTGWDSSFSNYLNASMFSGGVSMTLTEQTSLTYHTTDGYFGDGTTRFGNKGNQGDLYSHAVILTHQFSDDVAYALENTFGDNTGLGPNNNQWYSFTHYLFVDLNDQWSVGGRMDWFRDADGQRVNVNGAGAGSYYESTLGLNWKPCSNLRIRPEVRWDWFSGRGKPYDSRDGGKTGTATSQFTFGLDAVLVF